MKDRDTCQKVVVLLCIAVVVCVCWLSRVYGEAGVEINETNFPDPDFREIVDEYDQDGDGFLSEGEIAEVDSMDIIDTDVKNMKGIKFFTSLKDLECINNDALEELDMSGCLTLTNLKCRENANLEKLDISRCVALKELDCDYNFYLTTLDASECIALKNLNLPFGILTSLDVRGCTALENLDCRFNELTSLDVSGCSALENLKCCNNELITLDVRVCKELITLDCSENNKMKELFAGELTKLEYLLCDKNTELTLLDINGCTSLRTLYCNDNNLKELKLQGCTSLEELICSGNKLTALDISICASLYRLDCHANQLAVLTIGDNTELRDLNCEENSLTELNTSACQSLSELNCRHNKLTYLNLGACNYLHYAYCSNNNLVELTLSDGDELSGLDCSNNQLTHLNLDKCIYLWYVDCSNNNLEELTLNEKMGCLDCSNNKLTQLNLSNQQSILCLRCSKNRITALNIRACPTLQNLLLKHEASEIDGEYGWIEYYYDKYGDPLGTKAELYVDRDVNIILTADDRILGFINRCYSTILGRKPESEGIQTWTNELVSGRKYASEIIDRFVNSPEFQGKRYSNGDVVEILYKAMLGRSSDPAGKANWVAKLDARQPLGVVINGFCVSKEFTEICNSYGIKPGSVKIDIDEYQKKRIQAFVERCYNIILSRDPDEGGMETWYQELKSGRKAASEIIDQFVNSPEFQSRDYSNEYSVDILYWAMLGRSSDAAGKTHWVAKLENGQPFAAVINGFCISKEFRGICDAYGIEPGTVKVPILSGRTEEELSMLALNAKAPITRRSETKPNRVEIINPSDTIDMNIGTAVQAVYINEEKAKEFIGRCYRVILGREASEAELTNWIGQMVNGTKTPDQIARGFMFSNEFKAKNTANEDLVKILYRVYMNRDADPEGLKTWTEKLNNGTSLKDLLDAFAKTSEFKKVVSEMGKQ